MNRKEHILRGFRTKARWANCFLFFFLVVFLLTGCTEKRKGQQKEKDSISAEKEIEGARNQEKNTFPSKFSHDSIVRPLHKKPESSAFFSPQQIEIKREADDFYDLEEANETTDAQALEKYSLLLDSLLPYSPNFQNEEAQWWLEICMKAGNIHQTYGRYAEAMNVFRLGFPLLKKTEQDVSLFYQYNLYAGTAWYFYNQMDSARILFENASSIYEQSGEKSIFPDRSMLYNSLGVMYYEAANYPQASNYFQRALLIIQEESGLPFFTQQMNLFPHVPKKEMSEEQQDAFLSFANNLAQCWVQSGQYLQAKQFYTQLYKIFPRNFLIIQNLGHVYLELNQFDSAAYYLEKIPVTSTSAGIKLLNDLGALKTKTGKEKATDFLNRALSMNEKVFSDSRNIDRFITQFFFSKYYQKEQNTSLALHHAFLAWKELDGESVTEWWKNGERKFSDSLSQIWVTSSLSLNWRVMLLQQMVDVLKVRLAEQEKELQKLKQKGQQIEKQNELSKRTISLDNAIQETAFRIIFFYREMLWTKYYQRVQMDNDEARFSIQESFKVPFLEALDFLNRRSNTFPAEQIQWIKMEWFEMFKGAVLRDALQSLGKKYADEDQKMIQSLRYEIGLLRKQLAALPPKSDSAEEKRKTFLTKQIQLSRLLKAEGFDSQNSLESFQKKMQYCQQHLTAEQAFISFVQSDTALHFIWLDRDNLSSGSIPLTTTFLNHFNQFIKKLYEQKDGERFGGWQLGKKLLGHFRPYFPRGWDQKNAITLLPDGILGKLPFEALTDENDRPLVHSKSFSYHYSIELALGDSNRLQQQSSFFKQLTKEDINQKLFHIAPLTEELPASAEETNSLHKLIDQEANLENFLKYSSRFSIIHVSSHAISNAQDPSENGIVMWKKSVKNDFVPYKLTENDFYLLGGTDLQLMVLSGCETASGKSVAGDGVLSIARSAMYVGAKGVVAGLWKSDDFATHEIMKRFYQYLPIEKNPSQALRRAKISFLEDPQIQERYKSPHYWSCFIYTGYIPPIHTEDAQWAFLIYSIVGIILGLFLIKRFFFPIRSSSSLMRPV